MARFRIVDLYLLKKEVGVRKMVSPFFYIFSKRRGVLEKW
jgi:hypothetical protein